MSPIRFAAGLVGALLFCAVVLTMLVANLSQQQLVRYHASQVKQKAAAEARAVAENAVYQAEVEEGIGAALVILLDTSGSMKEPVPGGSRAKHVVAREAIAKMLEATTRFQKEHPDFAVEVGLMHFASSIYTDVPIQAYDAEVMATALRGMPEPGGGTAIGEALLQARPALYRAGVYRKYILCVTDGENTAGAEPATVARTINRRSEGAVQIHVVAFDTSPEKFSFVTQLGGELVSASDARGLAEALHGIYEGKILAEAADYGETDVLPATKR